MFFFLWVRTDTGTHWFHRSRTTCRGGCCSSRACGVSCQHLDDWGRGLFAGDERKGKKKKREEKWCITATRISLVDPNAINLAVSIVWYCCLGFKFNASSPYNDANHPTSFVFSLSQYSGGAEAYLWWIDRELEETKKFLPKARAAKIAAQQEMIRKSGTVDAAA